MLLALIATASAAEFTMNASVAASYWPLGLRFETAPGVKIPLWNQEDSVLFGDTSLKLECLCQATPAYARVGPKVTFSPIAILDLSAHYTVSPYFGTFTSFIGFDDPDTAWTPEVMDAKVEDGNRGTGLATRWGTSATLKAKVGPIIVAANGELRGWELSTADNVVGGYLYEPETDLLLARSDTTRHTTAVLLYERELSADKAMRVGAMNSTTASMEAGGRMHRLGPMATLSTADGTWSYLLLVQAQLEHRVEVEEGKVFPPYVALRAKWQK
ncbi:MAG: hypothetical protein ACI8RZ_001313 [Myxococcota bacterium]|jgi:hypothetical protein